MWISGGMEMENDADSVALMSMYTEIRRKAGYTAQSFLSFPIFIELKNIYLVFQKLYNIKKANKQKIRRNFYFLWYKNWLLKQTLYLKPEIFV